MNNSQRIKTLQESEKNVFSARNLRQLWKIDQKWFGTTVKRMVDNGILTRIGRGYYLFGKDLNPLQLANTIIEPSYVSLDSALRHFNVNFQVSQTIDSVASISYKTEMAGYVFQYHKIKDSILFDLRGVKRDSGISVASPERAILDGFYYGLLLNIDRPQKINKTYLDELSKIYPDFVQEKAKAFAR